MNEDNPSLPVQPIYYGFVAGTPHAKPDISILTVGDPVNLIAEPQNQYDPEAIMVHHEKAGKLGYIPKMHTYLIHAEINAGDKFTATITELNPSRKWSEITICVLPLDDSVPTPQDAPATEQQNQN